MAVALLDINQFKLINDTYGHLIGDQVLSQVAALLREVSNPSDLVARYGGEEFVILRPNASAAELAATCQQISKRISAFDWSELLHGPHAAITVSLGVAQTEGNLEEALSQADKRMYIAKLRGSANVQTQG